MEFGRVAPQDIANIDFSLPPDGKRTLSTLNKTGPAANPRFYVGCAKWGRKEWVKLIYPEKTKEKDFLAEYVKHFNSIELNAIFYGIPKEEQIEKWKTIAAANAGSEFLFCPKFSSAITHIKRLINAGAETDRYLKGIAAFGKFLGPCFLQLSDNFSPRNLPALISYLTELPQDIQVFVEVRHKDWFEDNAARAQLFDNLARLGKGAVITDASGRRDSLHMELPVPAAFIRFVGNGKTFFDSDKARIDEWVNRLTDWLNRGLETVYFFLHQHDESDTPLIADYTIKQFNKKLGSQLNRIKFIEQQGGLF